MNCQSGAVVDNEALCVAEINVRQKELAALTFWSHSIRNSTVNYRTGSGSVLADSQHTTKSLPYIQNCIVTCLAASATSPNHLRSTTKTLVKLSTPLVEWYPVGQVATASCSVVLRY